MAPGAISIFKEKNMANCTNCGKKLSEGEKFCPSCGTAVKSPSKKAAAKSSPPVVEQNASPQDAEENKGMALIAYVLFFVPLVTGDYKKSPFVKFHTNQGTLLAIAAAGLLIVWAILSAIISAIIRSMYRVSLSLAYSSLRFAYGFARFSSVVMWVLVIAILALLVVGILNVVNGKMKQLPVIGKFTIIK